MATLEIRASHGFPNWGKILSKDLWNMWAPKEISFQIGVTSWKKIMTKANRSTCLFPLFVWPYIDLIGLLKRCYIGLGIYFSGQLVVLCCQILYVKFILKCILLYLFNFHTIYCVEVSFNTSLCFFFVLVTITIPNVRLLYCFDVCFSFFTYKYALPSLFVHHSLLLGFFHLETFLIIIFCLMLNLFFSFC